MSGLYYYSFCFSDTLIDIETGYEYPTITKLNDELSILENYRPDVSILAPEPDVSRLATWLAQSISCYRSTKASI